MARSLQLSVTSERMSHGLPRHVPKVTGIIFPDELKAELTRAI